MLQMFVLALSLYNTIEFKVSFFYAKSRTCSFIVYSLSDDAAPAIAKIQPQEITWSENDYWYYDDLEQPKNVLKNYFSDIKGRYRNLDIRKWNYAKMQAVKEAEQYLTDK